MKRFVRRAGRGRVAVVVVGRAGARAHEVVDQRIARPGVAGDRIGAAIDEGDIGDAADVEHRDRMRPVDRADDGAMKHRHQRRTLPAGRDIGLAEIVNHRNAEPLRQLGAVADLDGELVCGWWMHGLAVEADHRDVARRDALGREQALDRLGMGPRGQMPRPRRSRQAAHRGRSGRRLGQSLPQQAPARRRE